MLVISKGRGEGKTADLINISNMTGFHIVCFNRDLCKYTHDLSRKMGIGIPYPITFLEFSSGRFSSSIKGFLIDDIDEILCRYVRAPWEKVKAATITTDKIDFEDLNDKLRFSVTFAMKQKKEDTKG